MFLPDGPSFARTRARSSARMNVTAYSYTQAGHVSGRHCGLHGSHAHAKDAVGTQNHALQRQDRLYGDEALCIGRTMQMKNDVTCMCSIQLYAPLTGK